jgi:pre-mRNA-splicing factor CWC26
MSGPKRDAILARSSDPTLRKKKKKPKNEDYIGGLPSKGESSGLVMRDEDEWKKQEDVDMDGEDTPCESVQTTRDDRVSDIAELC